ncbi:signal peptidase I [Halostella sp. JP-L12]|uniref:signal peptidase I n=1 Tax=Halostella TaxID=1843185 RepID=UPI000EF7DA67|nr:MULTISPECIES: signal peptidase I [Halostella]NHN48616.1 signal peptidase I [Halostella sp. JP-L12]
MTLRSAATAAFEAVAVVVIVSLLVGQALGQPMLLGYVATDSMEPTIEAGDGFVAVPSALAGDVEEGDVIVFEARTLHGGGLTTHRVVDETPEGYVTRGDANPFTDQDSDEPPVGDAQVRAKALQVGGSVVTIPHLGTAIMAVEGAVATVAGPVAGAGVGGVLVAVGLLLFAIAGVTGKQERATSRTRRRPGVIDRRVLFGLLLLVVVVPTTAAMLVPSGATEYGVVVGDRTEEDPLAVEPGERATVTYEVHNDGAVPTLVLLEPASDGVSIETRRHGVPAGGTAATTVTLDGGDAEGEYRRAVSERRYLAVLPASTLTALHRVHPLLAVAAVDAVVGALAGVLAAAAVGVGDQRLRSTAGARSAVARLRRRLM